MTEFCILVLPNRFFTLISGVPHTIYNYFEFGRQTAPHWHKTAVAFSDPQTIHQNTDGGLNTRTYTSQDETRAKEMQSMLN